MVALVVGIDDYPHPLDLSAAVNDAKAIELYLDSLDYDVDYVPNPTRDQLMEAAEAFKIKARTAVQVVLYYSGHGAEHNGTGYVLPRGKRWRDQRDLVKLDDLTPAGDPDLSQIIIIDACRTGDAGIGDLSEQGMNKFLLGKENTVIAYATAPGTAAFEDGKTGHGFYTGALLKRLAEPKADTQDVELVFIEARKKYFTHDRQTPAQMANMRYRYSFRGPLFHLGPRVERARADANQHRPALRWIPAGVVAWDKPDGAQRIINVASIWVSETEVSVGQFSRQLGLAVPESDAEHPVRWVSLYDAMAYLNSLSAGDGRESCYALDDCVKPNNSCGQGRTCFAESTCDYPIAKPRCRGYRLPSDQEWALLSRAAPATGDSGGLRGLLDGEPYYSDAGRLNRYAVFGRQGSPARVRSGREANGWRLFDTIGNVWELVEPKAVSRSSQVVTVRGCGYDSPRAECQSGAARAIPAALRLPQVGFRVVRSHNDESLIEKVTGQ